MSEFEAARLSLKCLNILALFVPTYVCRQSENQTVFQFQFEFQRVGEGVSKSIVAYTELDDDRRRRLTKGVVVSRYLLGEHAQLLNRPQKWERTIWDI